MKNYLLLIFIFCTHLLIAQTFTEVNPAPFEQLRGSTVKFADADGDGDEDILINGSTGLDLPNSTKLYLNDGSGNFTEMAGTPFVGTTSGSVIFSDLNGDGSPDVLISGNDNDFNFTMSFYINDGMANFTEVTGLSISKTSNGEMAVSDVDSDGDPDILVTGWAGGSTGIVKLYLNDGMANFTEMTDSPFIGVEGSSLDFSDVDGDGDEDVLIIGFTSGFPLVSATNLYLNDGTGNFSLVEDIAFIDFSNGSVAFSDIDLDGDADVLLSGTTSGSSKFTKLYTNDGAGNFTEAVGNPFLQVSHGSITFSDVDNDGDEDVLLSGNGNGASRSTKLYLNDGLGSFTLLAGTTFPGLSGSSAEFSDIDADGDLDVLMSGFDGSTSTKLYFNSILVGIEETLSEDLQVVAQPNPFQHTITVDFAKKGEGHYRLLDVTGRVWQEQRFEGMQLTLENLEHLPKGTYFLELLGTDFRAIRKVMK